MQHAHLQFLQPAKSVRHTPQNLALAAQERPAYNTFLFTCPENTLYQYRH